MSLNRRADKMERMLNAYMSDAHIKKRAFVVMRKLTEIDRDDPENTGLYFETLVDLLRITGSDSIKHKLNITD